MNRKAALQLGVLVFVLVLLNAILYAVSGPSVGLAGTVMVIVFVAASTIVATIRQRTKKR